MSENRLAEVSYIHRLPAGRSVVGLLCPFCGVTVEVRAWSLAGSGKRCECGAVLTGVGGSSKPYNARKDR